MELDVLHRADTPEIIAFYGAFFIESWVLLRQLVPVPLSSLPSPGVDVIGDF